MTALEFLLDHGEWASRDCDDCQAYIFEHGQIKRGRDGEPLRNPAPPPCERTPCRSRDLKPRLDAVGLAAYRAHRYCQFFGCFPEPGGLEAQNPVMLELILLVDDFHRKTEARRGSSALAALAAAVGFRRF